MTTTTSSEAVLDRGPGGGLGEEVAELSPGSTFLILDHLESHTFAA